MLQSLYIKNFVLMDEIRLDFGSGMSVFTGETGAGKSITIDAIALLMGERFQSHYMKDPEATTYLEATFTTANPAVLSYLRESGFEVEEGELIVAREFRPDGKSRAFLNHRSVNATMLKETIGQIVDIHSQHQNQYLLNKKYHLQLLDRYLRNSALIQEVASLYTQYQAFVEEKAAFLESDAFTDIDYVRFQWQEIEDLQFDFDEYHEIQDRYKRMGAFEKNQQTLNGVLALLEEESTPSSILYEVQRQLDHVEGEEMRAIGEDLKNIYYTLEDVVERIHAFAEASTFDEEQFVQDQEYLFKVNKIARKYHNSLEEMLKKHAEYALQIERYDHQEQYLAQLEATIHKQYERFEQKALELRSERQTAAKALTQEIMAQLSELYLPHAVFALHFSEKSANALGLDGVEFFISMNVNQKPMPLKEVASGGELSRLMLGLKTIFTRLQGVECVIFDEIDSGVSGKVALAIGQKMRQLAHATQVFTITHLASVAACAHAHYYVEKTHSTHQTTSQIRLLEEKEIVSELAMMSANSTSEIALASAKELWGRARKD